MSITLMLFVVGLTFPDHLKLCKNNCPLWSACVFTTLNLSFYFLVPDCLCSKLLPANYKSEVSIMGFFSLHTLMDIVPVFCTLYSNSIPAPHMTAVYVFVCWVSPCTPWCISSQCQGWMCGLFTSVFHAAWPCAWYSQISYSFLYYPEEPCCH